MRFIKFNDKNVDSFLYMELADLTKTLTKNDDIEVGIGCPLTMIATENYLSKSLLG